MRCLRITIKLMIGSLMTTMMILKSMLMISLLRFQRNLQLRRRCHRHRLPLSKRIMTSTTMKRSKKILKKRNLQIRIRSQNKLLPLLLKRKPQEVQKQLHRITQIRSNNLLRKSRVTSITASTQKTMKQIKMKMDFLLRKRNQLRQRQQMLQRKLLLFLLLIRKSTTTTTTMMKNSITITTCQKIFLTTTIQIQMLNQLSLEMLQLTPNQLLHSSSNSSRNNNRVVDNRITTT